MISPVAPGTIGRTHGRAVDAPPAPPRLAPPDVAVAVGAAVHWLGLLPVSPLGTIGVTLGAGVGAPVAGAGVPVLVPALGAAAPPPTLALALEAPARASAAKPGSIRWGTRKRSLSWACGVS